MSNMAKPRRWPSTGEQHQEPGPEPGPNVVPIRVDAGADPLDSFTPESGAAAQSAPRGPVVRLQTSSILTFAALVTISAVAAGAFFLRARILPSPAAAAAVPPSGRVALNSRPPGAAVSIDGVARGTTPLELELPAGSHQVVFRTEGSERQLELKVEANTRVSENVDMPPAVAATGVLEITSDPTGARVSLDGTSAGQTPLTLRNVSAARHSIVVSANGSSITRAVEVASGATASVFVALGSSNAGGAASGTFAVDSPIEMRVLENGQLLGLSNAAPIVVSAGRHQFDLVNESLQLRINRAVSVDAGKLTRIAVTVPNGTLAVNALPWAEVFVDGRSVGVTPLGSVSVPVGTHEVVWRHPQLGEKRRTVVVGAESPARVTMDMSK